MNKQLSSPLKSQKKNGTSIQNKPQPIRQVLERLREIKREEEEMLIQFNKMAQQCQSISEIYDILEALNYELSVRNTDKEVHYDKIESLEKQHQKEIQELKNEIGRVTNETFGLNKFHSIRSLRQTGRYVAFSQKTQEEKQKLLVSKNDLETVNLITSTEDVVKAEDYEGLYIESQGISEDQSTNIQETQMYDWILDIDLITNITTTGWPVYIGQKFSENQNFAGLIQQGQIKKWEGATVAVVGLYDKGKTFVLNNLTQSNLPSGKKVTTKGISFKHVDVDSGTQLILVDTAGSYSPVRIESQLSIVEKEATEHFILDLVFELSDYFICVVNDFTSLDQRYLDRLSRNLQNSSKTFREIIVIHNLKEVESPEILHHVWTTQVTQIYSSGGSAQRTKVAAINPLKGELQEKHVLWFKTQYTRHVCLVSDDSYLGLAVNPWVFSLLKYWLKAVFIPVNRQFSVCDMILQYSKNKLSSYFKSNLNLKMADTEKNNIKRIVQFEEDKKIQSKEVQGGLRIPQISIDQSGLILARPDSFIPATDIIAQDKYVIYMDVPGISEEEIEMYRQNVVTIVKGNRKRPYPDQQTDQIEKQERKYGEFTLSFKIPENYERKWSYFGVENGVLKIIYEKDKDDLIPCKYMNQ